MSASMTYEGVKLIDIPLTKERLVQYISPTDAWLSPDGECYPCKMNIPPNEENDFEVIGTHQPSAVFVFENWYGRELDHDEESTIQDSLVREGWIRLDVEHVWSEHPLTEAQRITLTAIHGLGGGDVCYSCIAQLLNPERPTKLKAPQRRRKWDMKPIEPREDTDG